MSFNKLSYKSSYCRHIISRKLIFISLQNSKFFYLEVCTNIFHELFSLGNLTILQVLYPTQNCYSYAIGIHKSMFLFITHLSQILTHENMKRFFIMKQDPVEWTGYRVDGSDDLTMYWYIEPTCEREKKAKIRHLHLRIYSQICYNNYNSTR